MLRAKLRDNPCARTGSEIAWTTFFLAEYPRPKMEASPVRSIRSKEGLHQLGWREGETFDLDAQFAGDDFSIIPRLAAELVARPPDVIVGQGARLCLRRLFGCPNSAHEVASVCTVPVAIFLLPASHARR